MDQRPFEGLATTFNRIAEEYQRARPGYPPELFVHLEELLESPLVARRVLEIGAGTGQATRGLLARGAQVVALEPGAELAAVARRVLAGLGDVEVVVAPFEKWEPAGVSFDIVLAATSWHWLDQDVAFSKAAELLRPGGGLAIVATEHVLPEEGGDPFFREVEDAYDAVGLGDGRGGPVPPEKLSAPDVASLDASGLFGKVDVRRYVWSRSYSADQYLALLSTYSGHIAAAPSQRERLFHDIRQRIEARPGASVRKHYLTTLQYARVLAGNLAR